MATLADTARFRVEDPDPLVLASLACPVCLHGEPVSWQATLDGYDPCVQCRCASCELHWCVYLTPQQSLRLHLMHVNST